MRDYFYADGSGLSEKFLSEKTKFLLELIEVLPKPTSELIKLYKELEANKPITTPENDKTNNNNNNNSNNNNNNNNTHHKIELSLSGINTDCLQSDHIKILLKSRKGDKEATSFLDELKKSKKSNATSSLANSSSSSSTSENETKKKTDHDKVIILFLFYSYLLLMFLFR